MKMENESMADRIRKVAAMVQLRAEKLEKAEQLKSEASDIWEKISAIEIPVGIYLVDDKLYRWDVRGFLTDIKFTKLD